MFKFKRFKSQIKHKSAGHYNAVIQNSFKQTSFENCAMKMQTDQL